MKKIPDNSEPHLPLPKDAPNAVTTEKLGTQTPAEMERKEPLKTFIEGSALDEDYDDNEFFLPIHGFVWFTNEELAVINHPAFQRLGEVNQLGQSHLVYRGGSHKRLEHALGTVCVADQIISAVEDNHKRLRRKKKDTSGSRLCESFSTEERVFIRLGALLHDIGHLPAGHTLEDELKLLPRHDEMKRLLLVLDKPNWPGSEAPSLRSVIDKEYGRFLKDTSLSASDLLLKIIAKDATPSPDSCPNIRVDVCRDIVGNTICADLLDYLHRDWYHIGKPKYFEKRLFQYMEIREDADGRQKFVISLGKKPRIKTDAVSAILDLLESRYQLAESVLFHRSKCSAAAMLERSIQELRESKGGKRDQDNWIASLEEKLLEYSDAGVLKTLLREAEQTRCEAAKIPLACLRNRRLYKDVYTTFHSEISITKRLTDMYTEGTDAPQFRLKAVRSLEQDFDLPPGSVVIYCPPKEMGAKIAEVNIHLDSSVQTFKSWDENEDTLAGGHLAAQLRRFARLWRVHVFLSKDEWEKMEPLKRDLLRRTIKESMLGVQELPVENPAYELALFAASVPGTSFYKKTPEREFAARRQPQDLYPSGAPTLKSFFKTSNEGRAT